MLDHPESYRGPGRRTNSGKLDFGGGASDDLEGLEPEISISIGGRAAI